MILTILIITAAVLAVTWWYLHRDPERSDAKFNGYVSPANGVVVDIINAPTAAQKKQFIKKGKHGITAFFKDFPKGKKIIVIMMKPQHIHTQRAPAAGTIKRVVYRFGLKRNAVFGDYLKATAENEHVLYVIEGKRPCAVYSIAGLLARRVRPIATLGQKVRQGERIAKITFGSQVAIILPTTKKILVKRGQTVIDGITPLAQ